MKNMGNLDRVLRLAVVAAILIAFAMGKLSGTGAIIAGIVAVAFLLTSAISFCPLYKPLGISTCRKG